MSRLDDIIPPPASNGAATSGQAASASAEKKKDPQPAPAAAGAIGVAATLRDELTIEERAELAEAQLRHAVPGDHPILSVITEMILYRRRYSEILEQFERVALRVERARRVTQLVVHPGALVGLLLIGVAVIAALAWTSGAAVAKLRLHEPAYLAPAAWAAGLALGTSLGWALRRPKRTRRDW